MLQSKQKIIYINLLIINILNASSIDSKHNDSNIKSTFSDDLNFDISEKDLDRIKEIKDLKCQNKFLLKSIITYIKNELSKVVSSCPHIEMLKILGRKNEEEEVNRIISCRYFSANNPDFPTRLKELIDEYRANLQEILNLEKFVVSNTSTHPVVPEYKINDDKHSASRSSREKILNPPSASSSIECIQKSKPLDNSSKRMPDVDYKKWIQKPESRKSVLTFINLFITNITAIFEKRMDYYLKEKFQIICDITDALEKLPSTNNGRNFPDVERLKNALTNCSDIKEKIKKIMQILDDPNFSSDKPHFPHKNLINKYKICIQKISHVNNFFRNIENLLLNKLNSILENIVSDHPMFNILKEALIEDKAENTFFKTLKVIKFISLPNNMDIFYSMLGITDEDSDDSKVNQHIRDLNPSLSDFFKWIEKFIEITYNFKEELYISEKDFELLCVIIDLT